MMIAAAWAFFVTLGMVAILTFSPLSKIALDQPNHRSLHTKVTPRTGGLAIMVGVAVAWIWLDGVKIFLFPAMSLLIICLVDDIKGLSVRWRLLAHLIIAGAFVAAVFPMPWWQFVLVLLAMVWMINLYNFMDGSDGLAGGMAVFGFGAYGIAAYAHGDIYLALLSLVIVASSLAFLIFNFHPASIFMGDSGSIPLGFLSAAIGFYGWKIGLWGWWFPVLVYSPFIVDASVTLFRRLLNCEKIWQAHRSHYYQRLILAGWGHKKTAFAEYFLMFLTTFSGIWMLNHENWIIFSLVTWLLIYIFIGWYVDRVWLQYKSANFIQ